MTRKRVLLKEILCARKCHLSAQELWEATLKEGTSVSLATVYNSLHHLVENGEVIEIRLDDGAVLYDARLDEHAHIHCTSCGEVQDLDVGQQIRKIQREAAKVSLYEFHTTEVTLKGICMQCQQSDFRNHP